MPLLIRQSNLTDCRTLAAKGLGCPQAVSTAVLLGISLACGTGLVILISTAWCCCAYTWNRWFDKNFGQRKYPTGPAVPMEMDKLPTTENFKNRNREIKELGLLDAAEHPTMPEHSSSKVGHSGYAYDDRMSENHGIPSADGAQLATGPEFPVYENDPLDDHPIAKARSDANHQRQLNQETPQVTFESPTKTNFSNDQYGGVSFGTAYAPQASIGDHLLQPTSYRPNQSLKPGLSASIDRSSSHRPISSSARTDDTLAFMRRARASNISFSPTDLQDMETVVSDDFLQEIAQEGYDAQRREREERREQTSAVLERREKERTDFEIWQAEQERKGDDMIERHNAWEKQQDKAAKTQILQNRRLDSFKRDREENLRR